MDPSVKVLQTWRMKHKRIVPLTKTVFQEMVQGPKKTESRAVTHVRGQGLEVKRLTAIYGRMQGARGLRHTRKMRDRFEGMVILIERDDMETVVVTEVAIPMVRHRSGVVGNQGAAISPLGLVMRKTQQGMIEKTLGHEVGERKIHRAKRGAMTDTGISQEGRR